MSRRWMLPVDLLRDRPPFFFLKNRTNESQKGIDLSDLSFDLHKL